MKSLQTRTLGNWGFFFLVVFLTLFIYGQTVHHSFTNFDDPEFFTDNPIARQGLSGPGFLWAFSNVDVGDWFPLTWLSIQLDYTLWGPKAGGHLLMNALYHGINTLLFFGFLKKATRAFWRPAFAALLFAVHPLRVESVAWAVERKDVLSACFWLLTLWAYLRYSRREDRTSYHLVILAYLGAAMSKSMVVTLPVVLLFLDAWPLKRKFPAFSKPLIAEKIPLFLISLITCVLAYLPKYFRGAISTAAMVPLPDRLANSLAAYVQYLGKAFWPVNLDFFYPYPEHPPAFWFLVLCLALLGTFTYLACVTRKRFPYFFTGWFWFLITLMPVIGIVKFASYLLADRYLYLPHLGLFTAMVWGISDIVSRRKMLRIFAVAAGIIVSGILTVLSYQQTAVWKDTLTLNTRSLTLHPENYQAPINLGAYYEQEESFQEAVRYYALALSLYPRHADLMNNLGNALFGLGRFKDAEKWYTLALTLNPSHRNSLLNQGLLLTRKGKLQKASASLEKALAADPRHVKTYVALADVRRLQNRPQAAWDLMMKALSLNPASPEAAYLAGNLKVAEKDYPAAKNYYQTALKNDPDYFRAALNLANILFLEKKWEDAAALYQQALQAAPRFPLIHLNLAKTYLKLRRLDLAEFHLDEVLRLNPDLSEARGLLEQIPSQKSSE